MNFLWNYIQPRYTGLQRRKMSKPFTNGELIREIDAEYARVQARIFLERLEAERLEAEREDSFVLVELPIVEEYIEYLHWATLDVDAPRDNVDMHR